jgi:hypothetical protein
MNNGILMMSIGLGIAGLMVMYLVIQFAVSASKAGIHAEYQTKLLAKIAEKQGVSLDEIQDCYKK